MTTITTTEIPLQALTEFALRLPMPDAADVTVEVMSPEIGDQVEARRLAWHGLVYDAKNDVLEISVRGPGDRASTMLRHEIHDPNHLWAEEIDGRVKTLSVMSGRRSQTIVIFHDRPALGAERGVKSEAGGSMEVRGRSDGDMRWASPDPRLERAREEAEGTEIFSDPFADLALEIQREEAEGVEVFADPYRLVMTTTLREGSPGHESLTGDDLGIAREQEEDDRRPEETVQR